MSFLLLLLADNVFCLKKDVFGKIFFEKNEIYLWNMK